jgi:lipocalin
MCTNNNCLLLGSVVDLVCSPDKQARLLLARSLSLSRTLFYNDAKQIAFKPNCL